VGQYDEAMQTLEAGHALTRQLKLPMHRALIEASLGRVCLIQNQVEAALNHYRTAREQAEQHGDYRTMASALAGEARALCRRSLGQDMSEATAAVQRAVELAVDRAPPVEAEARLALAELAFLARRTGEAVDEILAAVKVLDRLGGQEQCEIEILLAAHDILRVAERDEEALEMLRRVWNTLRPRARRISSDEVRESFMQRVPHNRRVEELWRASRDDLGQDDQG